MSARSRRLVLRRLQQAPTKRQLICTNKIADNRRDDGYSHGSNLLVSADSITRHAESRKIDRNFYRRTESIVLASPSEISDVEECRPLLGYN